MSARKTLLEIVQDIMSSLDSDNVNGISDTVEAIQVVDIIEETYYEFLTRSEMDYHLRLEQLESVGDTAQPTKIKIPDSFVDIKFVKYRTDTAADSNESWTELKYETPGDFLHRVQRRNDSETNVDKITTDNGVPIYIFNDRMPAFWTSFDNQNIYFDAFDSDEETTVEESRTAVLARVQPAFVRSDTYIPDIPTQAFPYLINEAKSKAFVNLKQQANPKVEAVARRQYVNMQEKSERVDRHRRFMNYGR